MRQDRHLLMTADTVGGVWQYAIDLARALVPHGYRTTLALLGPAPSTAQRRVAAGVQGLTCIETGLQLDWMATHERDAIEASRGVAALVRTLDPDVVQLNAPSQGCSGEFDRPFLCVAHGCPGSWWHVMEGGTPPADVEWAISLAQRGIARARTVVAPSAAFAEIVRRCYHLPFRPEVVHNGRRMAGRSPKGMHDFAFTAGRLWDRAKNMRLLDAVAGRLSHPFMAAGPVAGPNGERLELCNIVALGRLDDRAVADRLASHPVFVSAARHEPFGLAVLEAAAAGCALVLSDIPSFRELWDGVAVFVDPDDADGYAEVLDYLIADAPKRLELGARAQERAARYTPETAAARMAGLYAGLGASEAAMMPELAVRL